MGRSLTFTGPQKNFQFSLLHNSSPIPASPLKKWLPFNVKCKMEIANLKRSIFFLNS
jgi:hypothetical protein